jgi:V/A-type H+-transporting ATPase subunit E
LSKASGDTLQKVSNEFEGELLADLQEGREQSLALISAAKKEAKDEVSKILETSVKQAEALKRQITGAAELDARNARLKVLEKAVNEAMADAVSKVSTLVEKRYEDALARLINEGVQVIGPNAVVSCSSRDMKLVSALLKQPRREPGKLTASGEDLKTAGGVALATPDGSIRFDNTFEARLERLRPTLRKEVADLLSG